MKKLITLLTLALLSIGSAWADSETIFFADAIAMSDQSFAKGTTEITSGQATITGGTMYVISGQTDSKKLITSQGFCHTNNNTYFKIELDEALAVGDVITAKSLGGTKESGGVTYYKGIWVSTTDGYPSSQPACSAAAATPTTMTANFLNYTVTEGDEYVGKTDLYIYRAAGATQYFDEFKITREGAAKAPVITTQPVGAKYAPNATATALSVVATASAGNLSYQWYSNSTASTEGAASISGATNAEYTPSTANEGTTYYYCVVTDANGSATSDIVAITVSNASEAVVGYTEAINGTALDARVLTGADNITISKPSFGSAITDQGSKTVYIDGTSYTNNKSWRKSVTTYDNQYVGYTLTVASGYKMNVSHVSARIAVADDTYKWYVEILDGAGTQVWRSGEKTTTKASSGVVDADVTDKSDIQGLTGNVTVNLYVQQGGSTKYFSINYLQLTVETAVDDRSTYAMSVSSNDETMGTVTPADGSEVTEGESVAFTATPTKVDYKFVKWTIDGTDYTENPYALTNVTATHTAVATFAKRFKVTYDLGEYAGNTGKVLNNVNRDNGYDEVWSADDDSYTIPTYAHKYLYREGYIFDKWQDGDGNTYASGAKINMTKDITLTPTWTATSQSLMASGAETVVIWSFAKADILFCDWQSDSKSGYHTQNVAVNGETIALPMSITAGKVGNWSRTDAIAQTNQNTTFTIPAVSGMVIEIAEANKEFSTTTIAGSTDYAGKETKSISYTYTGTDATIDIVIGEGSQYLKTIKVTYPAAPSSVTITPANAKSTYVTQYAMDFSSVEGLTAYVATSASAEGVTMTMVDEVPAKTPLVLVGTANNSYEVPVLASATAPETNLLKAGEGSNKEFDGSTYDYILYSDGKFYQIGSGSVATTKAYLHLDAAPSNGARTFSLIFSETTRVNKVKADDASGEVYNLAGQRVATPQKGLYIVNGKKVIIK